MKKNWQKANYNIETHPFDTFIFTGIRFLIIGTFPTYKDNFCYNFFYSGKDNLFWDILQQVFKQPLKFHSGENAVSERHRFLKDRKIGITDMHQTCYRKNNLSTDENLFPIILTDIFLLLRKYPTIERIVLTSRTEIFGALGLFQTYFIQQKQVFPTMSKRPDRILEGEFIFDNRSIKILVPYSPSPRLIGNSITTKSELINMYKTCLT